MPHFSHDPVVAPEDEWDPEEDLFRQYAAAQALAYACGAVWHERRRASRRALLGIQSYDEPPGAWCQRPLLDLVVALNGNPRRMARSLARSTRKHLAYLEPDKREYAVHLLEIYDDAVTALEGVLTWRWLRFEVGQRTELLQLHRELERNRRRAEGRGGAMDFYAEREANERATSDPA